MTLATIDEIAQDVITTLADEDKRLLSGQDQLEGLEQVWFESSFARWIRNRYGLWYTNPLTENWRTNEAGRTIIDGVDHSTDHPDAISAEVVKAIKQTLKCK